MHALIKSSVIWKLFRLLPGMTSQFGQDCYDCHCWDGWPPSSGEASCFARQSAAHIQQLQLQQWTRCLDEKHCAQSSLEESSPCWVNVWNHHPCFFPIQLAKLCSEFAEAECISDICGSVNVGEREGALTARGERDVSHIFLCEIMCIWEALAKKSVYIRFLATSLSKDSLVHSCFRWVRHLSNCWTEGHHKITTWDIMGIITANQMKCRGAEAATLWTLNLSTAGGTSWYGCTFASFAVCSSWSTRSRL